MKPDETRDLIRSLWAGNVANEWLPLDCFTRQAEVESGLNPEAVNARTGATGLYQFMQPTWDDDVCRVFPEFASFPEGPIDPNQAVRAALMYLAKIRLYLAQRWDVKSPNVPLWAVFAAYNWGMGHVARLGARSFDEAAAELPAETRNYVLKILGETNV